MYWSTSTEQSLGSKTWPGCMPEGLLTRVPALASWRIASEKSRRATFIAIYILLLNKAMTNIGGEIKTAVESKKKGGVPRGKIVTYP